MRLDLKPGILERSLGFWIVVAIVDQCIIPRPRTVERKSFDLALRCFHAELGSGHVHAAAEPSSKHAGVLFAVFHEEIP
jgi:hypothetical protein